MSLFSGDSLPPDIKRAIKTGFSFFNCSIAVFTWKHEPGKCIRITKTRVFAIVMTKYPDNLLLRWHFIDFRELQHILMRPSLGRQSSLFFIWNIY